MAEREQIYFVRPDNVQVLLNDEQNFKLAGFRGLGVDAKAITSRTPYRHGGVYRWLYAPGRTIDISLQVYGDYASRRAAEVNLIRTLQVFGGEGTLRIVRPDGTVRRIDAVLVKWGVLEGNGQTFPGAAARLLTFYAPDPFFRDDEPVTANYPLSEEPPQSFPRSFPVSWGGSQSDLVIEVQNDGDVETWPIIRITGPADDPIVTNETTGKMVRVNQNQDTGDYIEIDMERGTVEFYNASDGTLTNILANVSDDSEFFPLVVGKNVIHISVQNAENGTATVIYDRRYVSM